MTAITDHKSFLSSLSPDETRALTERRNAPGLWRLASLLLALVVFSTWIGTGASFWGVALVLQASLLLSLFTLEHECTHETPFKSPALSEICGRVSGFLGLIPFTWFRYFHFAHHRHTNIPGKDPELDGDQAKYSAWGPFLWHVSGIPTWASLLKQLWASARGQVDLDYLPHRVRPRVIREARWHLALYALAGLSLFWSPLLFWIWILPALLGQPILRLYLMAEHGRCAFAANMFDNTRTTYTTALIRWMAWNMPYHTAHHVFPSVPFHLLPDLHGRMAPYVQRESTSYTEFTAQTLRDLPSRG